MPDAFTLAVFVAASLALCTDSLYALLSGTAGNWLRRRNESACFRRRQRYLALGAAATGSGKDG